MNSRRIREVLSCTSQIGVLFLSLIIILWLMTGCATKGVEAGRDVASQNQVAVVAVADSPTQVANTTKTSEQTGTGNVHLTVAEPSDYTFVILGFIIAAAYVGGKMVYALARASTLAVARTINRDETK